MGDLIFTVRLDHLAFHYLYYLSVAFKDIFPHEHSVLQEIIFSAMAEAVLKFDKLQEIHYNFIIVDFSFEKIL